MNNQTQTGTKDFTASAKSQADTLTDKIGDKAEQFGFDKDQVKDTADKVAGTASDKMNDAFASAKEQLTQGYEIASTQLKAVGSQFEGVVRSNPLLAIGVAAGLGWAVGRFLTRPSTDRT